MTACREKAPSHDGATFTSNKRLSLGLSSTPPDIPLIILRLSFSAVKGNLNQWVARYGPMARAKRLTLRSMEARRRRKSWALVKKFVVFAFAQTRFPLGQVSYFRTG